MCGSQMLRQVIGLAAWLLATFVAAAIGAIASVEAAAFYLQLARPAWAPPAGVFGPVWSVLYTLIAVAAYRVWRKGGFRLHRTALVLFLVQLVLNALWSWLFFAWHRGALAFVDILLLLVTIACNVDRFLESRSRRPACCSRPPVAWVLYRIGTQFRGMAAQSAGLGLSASDQAARCAENCATAPRKSSATLFNPPIASLD